MFAKPFTFIKKENNLVERIIEDWVIFNLPQKFIIIKYFAQIEPFYCYCTFSRLQMGHSLQRPVDFDHWSRLQLSDNVGLHLNVANYQSPSA